MLASALDVLPSVVAHAVVGSALEWCELAPSVDYGGQLVIADAFDSHNLFIGMKGPLYYPWDDLQHLMVLVSHRGELT